MNIILATIFLAFGINTSIQNRIESNPLQSKTEILSSYTEGLEYLAKNDLPNAFLKINNGLKNAKILEARGRITAMGYYYMSDYYTREKDYTKAFDMARKGLKTFQEMNNSKEIANGHSRLGAIHTRIFNFKDALSHYLLSLKLSEENKDKEAIANYLNKIGEIYLLTDELETAEFNFKKSLLINKELKDDEEVVFTLTNLGASYQKMGQLNKAIENYNLALVKAEPLGLKRSQSILLGNIGSSLRNLNRLDESLNYLYKALELKKELGRLGSAAHSCNDISETYMMMNQFNSAKIYALEAISLAKNESLNQERYAYLLLARCNAKLGEHKEAYLNLNKYNTLQDSIFSIEKAKGMKELQVQYETEKRDLRLKAQESDIALLYEKDKTKNQFIGMGTVALIGLFGFILIVRSRNKSKQREQMQAQFSIELMQSQEEEKVRIAKDLHDSVGQQLTLIKQKAQQADQSIISDLTHNALEEIRSISRGLYPVMLQQLGLTESIEQLVLNYDENSDLFFSLELDNINSYLNKDQSLNLYRFIQEGLNNIIKHAKAKSIDLCITSDSNIIRIKLHDNGRGFNVQNAIVQNSLGIKTLKERIRHLNGKLNIHSSSQKGTTITAVIPINS